LGRPDFASVFQFLIKFRISYKEREFVLQRIDERLWIVENPLQIFGSSL
jgi:hypothetical protein